MLAVFLSVALTLQKLEFSSGAENLVVNTVLEMERGGPRLVPNLMGQPRTAKPPLAAWVSWIGVREQTVRGIESSSPSVRDSAYRALSWDVRWVPLACICLGLLAVYDMARTLGGRSLGLVSVLICASTLMFLRFSRNASTDIQLATWVWVTWAFLARWILRGEVWQGAVGTGIALGLALMSKGPVALVQTVLPAVLFILIVRKSRSAPVSFRGRAAWALAVMLTLVLGVGGWWFAVVWLRDPGVAQQWLREVSRVGATDLEPDAWYNYLAFPAWMFPWTIFLLVGLWQSSRNLLRRIEDPAMLCLLAVVVPIVVMSFFRDRKERYLLPVIAPASVVAATALLGVSKARQRAWSEALLLFHVLGLGALLIGIPIAGVFPSALRTVEGGAWYPVGIGVGAAVVGIVVISFIAVYGRRCPIRLSAATLACMLAFQALFVEGYRNSREGRSEMRPLADAVRARCPDAAVWSVEPRGRRAPSDLAIYLNRVVTPVRAFSDIPVVPGEQVAVLSRRRSQPPVEFPPGWVEFKSVPRDNSTWHAAYRRVP
jgi:4-amino-4-deoxy-L-arabinose transferase-like glycosyltransferase